MSLVEKKKKTSKKKVISIEEKINEFEKFFPSPAYTRRLLITARELVKAGYAMRKGESELSYLFRVNYCIECNIALCFVNLTYNIGGKVSRMVELKGILFEKRYPNNEVVTQYSTPEKCMVMGKIGDGNWVKVEYDLEKAKKLDTYKANNKHWVYNPQRMLNKTCKGDLYDFLSGTPMSESQIDDLVEEEK